MKIQKNTKFILNEASELPDFSSGLFRDDENIKRLSSRRISIKRAIQLAKEAQDKALKNNNAEAAEKMANIIDELTDWLNKAPDMPEPAVGDGSTDANKDADTDTEDSKKDSTDETDDADSADIDSDSDTDNDTDDAEAEQSEASADTGESDSNEPDTNSNKTQSKADASDSNATQAVQDANNSNGSGSSKNSGQSAEQDPWQAFLDSLATLSADAAEGAAQAISEYSQQLTESLNILKEDYKAVQEMSDDEFNRTLNRILEKIDAVDPIKSVKNNEDRIQEIKKAFESPLKAAELNSEDATNIRTIKHAEAIKQKELEKEQQGLPGMNMFTKMFNRAIADQIEEAEDEEETYSVINRRHEDDPSIVKRGVRIDDQPTKIPTIDVYMDCSASWKPNDIDKMLAAVKQMDILAQAGKIKLNKYYFDDYVYSTFAEAKRDYGSTDAWPRILENIKAHKTKNSVLLTDTDMNAEARVSPKLVVPGHVWLIWKNRYKQSSVIPTKLQGKLGTNEFVLY